MWITWSVLPHICTHFLPPRLWNPVLGCLHFVCDEALILFRIQHVAKGHSVSSCVDDLFIPLEVQHSVPELHPVWISSSPCWALISDSGPFLLLMPTLDSCLTPHRLQYLLWATGLLGFTVCAIGAYSLIPFNCVCSELKKKRVNSLKIKVTSVSTQMINRFINCLSETIVMGKNSPYLLMIS